MYFFAAAVTGQFPTKRPSSLALALSIAAVVAVLLASSPGGRLEPLSPAFSIDPDLLEEGDLVFRRGKGIASRLVLLSDASSIYSHVGLLILDGTEPRVVHVVPAESAGDPAPVRVESLTTFIDVEHASAVSVRRLEHARSRHYAALSASAARDYVRQVLSFDARFDLDSRDRLYCTELVWRAYLEAGIDLVDGVFTPLKTPFGTGSYLTLGSLGSLLDSRHLREVVSVQT